MRNVLHRHGIVPAPVRTGALGWRHLMHHYKRQLLACDFLTVETLFLKTLYVFFFIGIGTRRVYFAGVTAHTNGDWVVQQARQFVWLLQEQETNFRHLIRDRDSKYTDAFNTVFTSESIHVIQTPLRAPNANTFAERWVRTLREECLDRLLILNETDLRRVLNEFIEYYNSRRPHQGLAQQSPIPQESVRSNGLVKNHRVLGGIINDYYRVPETALIESPVPQQATPQPKYRGGLGSLHAYRDFLLRAGYSEYSKESLPLVSPQ